MSKEQVVEQVRHYVDSHQPENFQIEVLDTPVRNDGDWWFVPVRANEPKRTYEYYFVLGEMEADMKQEMNLDVLLVPAV